MIIGHQILASKASSYLSGLPCDALYFVVDAAAVGALPSEFVDFMQGYHYLELEIHPEAKSTAELAELWTWLHAEGASRASVVVAVGGGTLSDLVGFAAASYMRGLRTVNISTTLLAMVDASVGGKTGIDFAGVKNLIGAFHEPLEVIIDVALLDTLPLDELYSGYGEVLKTALLAGPEQWRRVLELGDPQMLTGAEWLELVEACVAYKAGIVAEDPEERSGRRAVLNLGHTVAHALEAYSRSRGDAKPLLHGEAVVIGLLVEGYLAHKKLGLELRVLRQLMGHVRELYPRYSYVCRDYPYILDLMRSDKKNEGQGIRFALLRALGEVELWTSTADADIEEALDFYREAFGG